METINNTILLLEEIKNQALKEKNYQHILEVLNKPEDSFSRYLEGYDTFILNKLVEDSKLESLGLKGENGTLTEEGIILPKKTIEKYKQNGIKLPSIEDFDLIIGNGISMTSFNASIFSQDKIFGFCTDVNDPNLLLRLNRAESLTNCYNNSPNSGYEMLDYSKNGKVYCLVKRNK